MHHHLLFLVPKDLNLEEVNNFFRVNEAKEDLQEDMEVALLFFL